MEGEWGKRVLLMIMLMDINRMVLIGIVVRWIDCCVVSIVIFSVVRFDSWVIWFCDFRLGFFFSFVWMCVSVFSLVFSVRFK